MQKDRILIIDDNKTLAKLIARKMQSSVDLDVDVAFDYAQTVDLMEENEYFLVLADLNLPDAPNGEVVDYVISKNTLVIVLTGSTDAKTKEIFIEKDIVDYVYKGDQYNVDYIFEVVDRLYKNRNYKVMVVDDSITMRNSMKKTLQSQLFSKVFAAAHGEEALGYFSDNNDIKVVITDYNMPVMDGMALIKVLRERYDKNSLIIIVLTSETESSVASNFLKHGANDFLMKPFSKDELLCRINNNLYNMENINRITNLASKDFLTGLYNRRFFYENLEKYIEKNSGESFALAMMDIDFFKKVNDTYGHDIGDLVIKTLAGILTQCTKGGDIVARFGGEEFCVVLKNITKENAAKMFVIIRSKVANYAVKTQGQEIKFSVSIGFVMNENCTNIDQLIKKADDALYKAKQNGRNRVEIA